MRRHLACPDCGWTPKVQDYQYFEIKLENEKSFNCPQCKTHYSDEDFMEENIFKWNRTADLNYEQH